MVRKIVIDCDEQAGEGETIKKRRRDVNIQYINCPHWVPPGVDPEDWDARKKERRKKKQ